MTGGASRDGGTYDPTATTVYRDRYYRQLFQAVHYLAEAGRPIMGTNVWSWAGEARPPRPGEAWRVGDPLIGDPPHEDQGWYSIYDADASTIASSQPGELETVKKNFLMKKLGLDDRHTQDQGGWHDDTTMKRTYIAHENDERRLAIQRVTRNLGHERGRL